jgi:para-nitrobenzyl esterase
MNAICPHRLPVVPLLICIALPLASRAFQADQKSLVVATTPGQIQGTSRRGGGAEFLGIPYAEPPVGNLRWHEPLPAKSWTGVRSATTFGVPRAQPDLGEWNRHDAETGKEDCLFLNVIVPEWPVRKPLPVMFWIHGGANEGGTASSALYKDGTLVNHGVILVTVNYRLGIFGFFAHPELTAESAHHDSGNYGLMDQILALYWVRDNIAKFGGDVDNVTVFGQSAGAMDTSMLMTSPLAKSLFEKALAESAQPSPPRCFHSPTRNTPVIHSRNSSALHKAAGKSNSSAPSLRPICWHPLPNIPIIRMLDPTSMDSTSSTARCSLCRWRRSPHSSRLRHHHPRIRQQPVG